MNPLTEATAYTPDELVKIAGAVSLSGAAIAMTDFGIVSTVIEAGALVKEISGAAKKYPNNSVIQALFSPESLQKLKAEHPAKMEFKPEEMQPDKIVDLAIAKVNDAIETMKGKATVEEVQEYKAFVYDCASQVANAAGSGLFGSGAKISEREAAALSKIKVALGL
jgi:hypothetical protein